MTQQFIHLIVDGEEFISRYRYIPGSGEPSDLMCRMKGCHLECVPIRDFLQLGFCGFDKNLVFLQCPRCRRVYHLEYEVEYSDEQY